MLRTRARSKARCSSLPSFCSDDDDVSSSSNEEDHTYIQIVEPMPPRTPLAGHCMMQQQQRQGHFWRYCLLRSFVIVAIFGIVGHNLRSRNSLFSNTSLVEFELNIWHSDNPVPHFFTVETIAGSPSADHFLKQVNAGVWDNTSIQMNAPHVILARPISGDGMTDKTKLLASLGSIEHEKTAKSAMNTHHLPYTLAFSEAGLSFYINKRWNPHHDVDCFARVVVGRASVDTVSFLPLADDDFRIQPVDIVKARVVSSRNFSKQARREYSATSSSVR